jgi:hypothetical protein
MAVCCQNLPQGALSSRSAPSVLVDELFKKFGIFLNTPCIIVLVIRHENRISSALYYTAMCGLSGCIPHFPPLCHKRHQFRGKKEGEHKTCDLSFSTTFVWNISNSKNFQRDIIIKVRLSSCKVPVILIRFSFRRFRKILKYQISWKSVDWEPNCPMRTDRQTWRS